MFKTNTLILIFTAVCAVIYLTSGASTERYEEAEVQSLFEKLLAALGTAPGATAAAAVATPTPTPPAKGGKGGKGNKGKGGKGNKGKGKGKKSGAPTTAASAGSPPSPPGTTWSTAHATYYESYPPCCREAPNYDPKAPKDECSDYNGCKWMGQFAGADKQIPYSEVQSRNIVAYYDSKNQSKGTCATGGKCDWWDKNAKGKKLIIKHPTTGKELECEVLDTCSDSDCSGCCTKNAKEGGGTLIDLEINTARRFWGKEQNGKIQWRWV